MCIVAPKPLCLGLDTMKRSISLFSIMLLALSPAVYAAEEALKAPTRLYPEPELYLLLRLPGDRATIHYTPGSLDRAANLQFRLEKIARYFHRWADQETDLVVYMVNRDGWQQAQFNIPYGVPLRVGRLGFAAPAMGDDGTVALWAGLLRGVLPRVSGTPLRGSPREAATMAVADVLVQLEVAEALVDQAQIAGDAYWVRGLMSHVMSVSLVEKMEPMRIRDLDTMYAKLSEAHPPKAMSVRDYHADLGLVDWLWFQAQFHAGAKLIVAEEGAGDAVEKMIKLRKKGDGVLRGDFLRRKYDDLDAWFHDRFSAVSFQTSR